MKCQNCGKHVSSKAKFCSNCSAEIIHQKPVVKQEKQVFRTILMIFLTICLFVSVLLLLVLTKVTQDDLNSFFIENKAMLTLNLFTLFLPFILATMVLILGPYVICAFNIICIIISGLTMIKATTKKKIYLAILIIIFIVLTIISAAACQNITQ